MISDREELLIVYDKKSEDKGRARKKKSRTAALWTNCNALVVSMLTLFNRMAEARETAPAAQAPEIGLQMEDVDS
jgi:hypothetical protein